MSLEKTKKWFEQAIPEPTDEQKCIQIGCHFEEVGEMMHALGDGHESFLVDDLAGTYKSSDRHMVGYLLGINQSKGFKVELLDSLADQIVTAVGVAHMMGFDILGALEEVNRSNFSKFEDGKPVFDDNGKITKGKNYVKPNLERFV